MSTRGSGPVGLETVLREGPAPDGGLYMPVGITPLDGAPAGSTLADTAEWMLSGLLEGEVRAGTIREVVFEALDFPIPLRRLSPNTWVLELTHGPSGAFKDVGARVLARALARWAPLAPGEPRTILVATSGDTGGAVAQAFTGASGVRVVVLFPEGRVSEVQRRLFTTTGGNVRALAVEGPFDACQRLAREAFADGGLRAAHGLISANSINLGRLLPQVAYYLHAARSLPRSGSAPTFVVPSGNLGNLTAGLLAMRMGMASPGFVAALNANDALARYLAVGSVETERPTIPTLSCAMDVGLPSNLERIRALAQDDHRALRRQVCAHAIDDDETLRTMAALHRDHDYVADPHTAVGFAALARARASGAADGPAVVLATAHPAKFPQVVKRVLGRPPPEHPALAAARRGEERWRSIPARLEALADALARESR